MISNGPGTFAKMGIIFLSHSLRTVRTHSFLITGCSLFMQRVHGLRTCLVLLRSLMSCTRMLKRQESSPLMARLLVCWTTS